MGMLELKRLMSRREQERRRRRKVQARCGSIRMSKPRKDNSQRSNKRLRFSGPNLPEDISCYIHSLMPMQDSARVARVSHIFYMHGHNIPTSSSTGKLWATQDITRSFTSIVDQILKNYTGNGVKTLELDIFDCHDLDPYLNDWLQIGITPGIENVALMLPPEFKEGYSFPCSLLFRGNGSSIRQLHLTNCGFHPTVGIGCSRSLTKLCLHDVCVTGDELGCLLSDSFALMHLELAFCNEIICLKIPCMLE